MMWDGISIVRRRTPGIKWQIVATTEAAFLAVVDAHTTASANTIMAVAKQLSIDKASEEEESK